MLLPSPAATRPGPRLWVGRALLVVAAIGYLVLLAPQLSRPLMYDDANFAFAARAVSETGLPYGNQGWMSERGDFSQREQWALWHPPLYVYALGLVARLFGPSPAALRLLGVLGGLAVGWLTFLLAGELTRGSPAHKGLAGGLAAALVLLSPLSVQSALLLDIDFSLLLPLSLLFLLAYVRLQATPRWAWLMPIVALLLWTKMTNPIALVVAAVAWQVAGGRLARAAQHGLVLGIGGVLLFGASWLGLASALGMPADMPFAVNLVQWRDSADVARRAFTGFGAFTEGLQPTVLWVGPWLVALGLLAAATRGAQLVTEWQPRPVDLVLGVAAIFVIGYVNKSAGWFPKYQVALVPLLAVAAAPLLASALRGRLPAALALLSAIASASITVGFVRDSWALERMWVLAPEAAALFAAVLVLAAGVGLLAGTRLDASREILRHGRPSAGLGKHLAILAALFGLALGWSVAVGALQSRAPYQTTYWYGTTGVREAVAWIDEHVAPGEVYVASKELAFAAKPQRYLDQETLLSFLEGGRGFDGTWDGQRVRAIVAWTREPYQADLLARNLPERGFHLTRRFGDYAVYESAP